MPEVGHFLQRVEKNTQGRIDLHTPIKHTGISLVRYDSLIFTKKNMDADT